jgi:hypothetical protein
MILGIIAFSSCKVDDPIDYSKVIVFSNPGEESIVADNISSLLITAHIDPKSDLDKKAITFTTDIGTFTNNTTTIIVTADKDGNASTFLKSNASGRTIVKATAQSVVASKPVLFTPFSGISFDDSNPATLAADNVSLLKITAQINPNNDVEKRTVVFTTDLGTFSNNAQSANVIADANGKAVTFLKGNAVGTATIKIANQGYSANKAITFTVANPDNIFKTSTIIDNVAADGVSTILIAASINKNFGTSQKINFSTDVGSFSNGLKTMDIIADQDGNVNGYLKSDAATAAHVSLSFGGINRNYTLNFVRAIPDYMLLTSANSLIAGIGNFVPITASLKRNIGKPGADFTFDYSATDVNGNPLGLFTNGKSSDANGEATVNYSAGNTTYKGPVKITISLKQYPLIKTSIDIVIL